MFSVDTDQYSKIPNFIPRMPLSFARNFMSPMPTGNPRPSYPRRADGSMLLGFLPSHDARQENLGGLGCGQRSRVLFHGRGGRGSEPWGMAGMGHLLAHPRHGGGGHPEPQGLGTRDPQPHEFRRSWREAPGDCAALLHSFAITFPLLLLHAALYSQ